MNQRVGLAAFSEALSRLRSAAFDEDSRVAIPLLMKIIRKAFLSPPNHKHRSIRLANEVFNWRLGRISGGIDALLAVGFQVQEEGSMLRLHKSTPPVVGKHDLIECFRLLEQHARALRISGSDLPRPLTLAEYENAMRRTGTSSQDNNPSPQASDFDPFRVAIDRIDPQPRGSSKYQSSTDREVAKLREQHDQILRSQNISASLQDSERAIRIYAPNSGFNARRFENTRGSSNGGMSSAAKSDSRIVMELAKKMTEKSRRNGMMTTKAMRDLEALRKQRIYKDCLIRIQFPSRLVVEAIFRPTETFMDVRALLKRAILSTKALEAEFYLFTTPPKRIVDSSATLQSAGCAPAALLYLGWTTGTAPAQPENLCREGISNGPSMRTSFPTSIKIDSRTSEKNGPQGRTDNRRHASNSKSGARSNGIDKSGSKGGKPSWLKL